MSENELYITQLLELGIYKMEDGRQLYELSRNELVDMLERYKGGIYR